MKTRVISGAVILLLLIVFMAFNSKIFAIFMLACSLLGLNEFLNIRYRGKKLKFVEFVAVVSLAIMVLNNIFFSIDVKICLLLPLLGLTMPIVFYNDSDKYNINDSLYVLGATLFLGLSFGALIELRDTSISYCILVFLVAFVTDTYAYIGGMLIGRRPLTSISPKKTWEGFLVGTFFGTLIGSFFYFFVIGGLPIGWIIVFILALSLLSEVGDLVFSSIKRYYGVKDYSNLIPGHGGILDRFDSVIFVALGTILLFGIF